MCGGVLGAYVALLSDGQQLGLVVWLLDARERGMRVWRRHPRGGLQHLCSLLMCKGLVQIWEWRVAPVWWSVVDVGAIWMV